MASESPKGNGSLLRKLAVASSFALINILVMHAALSNDGQDRHDYLSTMGLPSPRAQPEMSSGVGLVTTDGMWNNTPGDKYKDEDIKILGFTDRNYLPIARVWYNRMTVLGYTEHYIVAHDESTYNTLRSENYRVIPCFIKNPDYGHPVRGLWQQIMSARLHLTIDILRNGTHILVTDIDNIFSRHVPLYGFLKEGYDVYHAFEMRYPVPVYNQFGYVICSGHQFLRSTPATLKFMDLVMNRCRGGKCDDQITYNRVFFFDLDIKWDGNDNPNHPGALRVNTTHPENNNLLVESVTGRSRVTNHTFKIWDRDFAWRLAGAIPEFCPSKNNWLGMPTKLDDSLTGAGNKVFKKIAAFEVWDKLCRVV